ncbi:hypothetical protein TSUD_293110 [Trifolium subterraneum]|uniref:Aminotransferase-like plant mobile domain-containing protein n=1 Tax=Trifolium subterraneum TaxID=3900 RepID=A0A2Z6N597_TRISU|nr:hypothetical protein TSUD_293110 [Trifolium subterraneum]
MEDNVGRTRQGRPSRAHSSARKELAANAPPPKRGRRGRQGPLVRGTHDAEAGGSRSRARLPVPDVEDDFDAGEYLNELAHYDDKPEAPQPQPRQQPQQQPQQQQRNVEEKGYGRGSHDYVKQVFTLHCQREEGYKYPKNEERRGVVLGSGYSIRVGPLIRTNFNVLNYGVLWAFAARWHPETSTFHLPLGEMGITLDAVQCLLHLPIEGKFLNHKKMTRKEGAEMVSSFLRVGEKDVMDMFASLNGPHLMHSFVAWLFSDYYTAADRAEVANRPGHEIRLYRERCIQAFLLYVDLSSVHEWNSGSAALIHLQHYLDDAFEVGTSQMVGYMSLLKRWIILHFPTLSMWQFAENVTDDMPLNAKFALGQGHNDARGYRQSVDNIQVSDCVFSQYDDHRQVRPLINACWFSGWLRCGNLKVKHLPERVLRLFKVRVKLPMTGALDTVETDACGNEAFDRDRFDCDDID